MGVIVDCFHTNGYRILHLVCPFPEKHSPFVADSLSSLWCQFKCHFVSVALLDHSIYSSAQSYLLHYPSFFFLAPWYHRFFVFINLIIIYCWTLRLEHTLQWTHTFSELFLPPVPRTVLEITQCVCNEYMNKQCSLKTQYSTRDSTLTHPEQHESGQCGSHPNYGWSTLQRTETNSRLYHLGP